MDTEGKKGDTVCVARRCSTCPEPRSWAPLRRDLVLSCTYLYLMYMCWQLGTAHVTGLSEIGGVTQLLPRRAPGTRRSRLHA